MDVVICRIVSTVRRLQSGVGARFSPITPEVLAGLPLESIESVVFYKRDQITTDLICCDLTEQGSIRTFHEEASGWNDLIAHMSSLPDFRSDWYIAVVDPPFATSETVAFRRT